MRAIHHSLARANGRGSAGQCPAGTCAKTPAARESGASSRRSLDGANHPGGDHFPDVTAQLSNRLLRAELAQLREAARDYYVRSDLNHLDRDSMEAADRLVRLLGHAELVA